MQLTKDRNASSPTRGNLRVSMADGATFGVMVGLGESYLAAFALAIGLGEVSAGLISSVPLLAGGLTQLISLRGVRWVGSEKRWILLGATIQALSFLPLVIAAIYGSISLGVVLVVASVYWAGGLATGPAWNTWMEAIVPRQIRPRYFARRTRVSQFTTFASFLGGGLVLHLAKEQEWTLYGFALIFALAGVFRLWSVRCLALHQTPVREIELVPLEDNQRSERDQEQQRVRRDSSPFARSSELDPDSMKLRQSMQMGGRLLAYLVVVQGVVQISGPYFAPFMLEEMDYSYLEYVGLLGIAFLSKVIALSWWATVAKNRSAQTLLWIGGIGIVPLGAMWLVSRNYWWLVFSQVLGGINWAAYELGFFLLFFEALPVSHRTRMLTLYNLGNTASWCAGALLGGAILAYLGPSESSYLALFGLSSLGRLLALGLLARVDGTPRPVRELRVRILGIRPNAASPDTPILSTIKREAA